MSKNPLINEADVHLIETMQSDKLAAIEFVLQRLAGLYIDDDGYTNELVATACFNLRQFMVLRKMLEHKDIEIAHF